MSQILILNGSPSGAAGNCQKLIKQIQNSIVNSSNRDFVTQVIHLSEVKNYKSLFNQMGKSHGLIFVTGTYWDSWGSPLQKFLENATDLEGTETFVGKPCAVFVLMHSVGGKGILSRLQGVLSTFGCLIPPMSGMVYSLVSDLALKSSKSRHKDDLWSMEDLDMVLTNFELALEIQIPWKVWPIDRKNFRKTWIK